MNIRTNKHIAYFYQQVFSVGKTDCENIYFLGIKENYLTELMDKFLEGLYGFCEYVKVHK